MNVETHVYPVGYEKNRCHTFKIRAYFIVIKVNECNAVHGQHHMHTVQNLVHT